MAMTIASFSPLCGNIQQPAFLARELKHVRLHHTARTRHCRWSDQSQSCLQKPRAISSRLSCCDAVFVNHNWYSNLSARRISHQRFDVYFEAATRLSSVSIDLYFALSSTRSQPSTAQSSRSSMCQPLTVDSILSKRPSAASQMQSMVDLVYSGVRPKPLWSAQGATSIWHTHSYWAERSHVRRS